MKILLLSLATLIAYSSAEATCDKKGLAIIAAQEELHTADYEYQLQKLELHDLKRKGAKPKKRILQRFSGFNSDGDRASSMAFLAPSDIRGTALLTWDKVKEEDDQWLYLPALKKPTRIAGSSKKKYFMGTDFTYADLQNENKEDYNYKCLKESKYKRKNVYIVEALPKNSDVLSRTGYKKRILTIRKSNFTSSKIEYFDEQGEPLKILKNKKWKKVGKKKGRRPMFSEMLRKGYHKTIIKTEVVTLDKKYETKIFTRRFLEKELHLKQTVK